MRIRKLELRLSSRVAEGLAVVGISGTVMLRKATAEIDVQYNQIRPLITSFSTSGNFPSGAYASVCWALQDLPRLSSFRSRPKKKILHVARASHDEP
jgi:hypothetical protein